MTPNRLLCPLFGVLLAFSLPGGAAFGQMVSSDNAAKPAAAVPGKKIVIALYADKGAFGKGPGMLTKTFASEADCQLVPVNIKDIRAGKLRDYQALIVPGERVPPWARNWATPAWRRFALT
jgi:hypothetical protein